MNELDRNMEPTSKSIYNELAIKGGATIVDVGDEFDVHCYGEIRWDSNFDVVCEDMEDDFIWLCRDTENHNTWEEIVRYLNTTDRKVVEISAV
jgi:hypothetical protein